MGGGYGSWGWGVGAVWWDGVSPIWGMCTVRAWWSLWLVAEAMMVAFMGWRWAVGGRRKSQWSSWEFVGMNVGVCGSPM